MIKQLMILVFLTSLCILTAQTQFYPADNGNLTGSVTSSLFNPYKLKMSHSMGFAAGTSSQGLGYYESRYTNHLSYEFSPKLDLALDLNFVNYGSASFNKSFDIETNDDNKTKILPEFNLRYKPSDSVLIQFGYRTMGRSYPWYGHPLDWLE